MIKRKIGLLLTVTAPIYLFAMSALAQSMSIQQPTKLPQLERYNVPTIQPIQNSTAARLCAKTAVEKRETTIINAFNTFSSSVTSNLSIRQTDLSAAWDITDNAMRRTAINNTWSKSKVANSVSRQILKKSRIQAWKDFSTARKACQINPTGENPEADITI